MLGAGAMVAGWLLLVTLAAGRGPSVVALIGLAHAVSAALLLSAAASELAACRVARRLQTEWFCLGLAVAGLGILVADLAARLPAEGPPSGDPTAAPRYLVHLALIAIGVAAFTASGALGGRMAQRTVAAGAVGCVLAAAVVAVRGMSSPWGRVAGLLVDTPWALAAAWAALGVAFAQRGLRRHHSADAILGAGFILLAVFGMYHLAFGSGTYRTSAPLAGVTLFVAATLAGLAAVAAWQLQSTRAARLDCLADELSGARIDLQAAQREQDNRLHDARSAVLAVAGATRLLTRPGDLPATAADRLNRMVAAELRRLGVLLGGHPHVRTEPFRLSDVIGPLVTAQRIDGTLITMSTDNACALGDPDVTATAVANVLANARSHAPGAHIWIHVRADRVATITVADDGPGIPEDEWVLVVQRGVRGSTARGTGSGIGLATAARAMADQGGSLAIGRRPGGGTSIVLTLPLAPAPAITAAQAPPAGEPEPAPMRHLSGELGQIRVGATRR